MRASANSSWRRWIPLGQELQAGVSHPTQAIQAWGIYHSQPLQLSILKRTSSPAPSITF